MYEISMLFNNEISEKKIRENTNSKEYVRELNLSNTIGLTNINPGVKNSRSKSSKMVEEIEVKNTKSIYLNKIYKKCKEINDLNDIKIGSLIKIRNIKLYLEEDENTQIVNMVSKGILKDFQVDGYNLENIMNPLIKDYSYLIKGQLKDSNEKIIIKIPMLSVNEFENQYSIYDILIGNVTIIGIYKGKIKYKELKNTFNDVIQSKRDSDIKENSNIIDESSYLENQSSNNINNDNREIYHYIDLIAITQDILFEDDEKKDKSTLWEKFKNIFIGK